MASRANCRELKIMLLKMFNSQKIWNKIAFSKCQQPKNVNLAKLQSNLKIQNYVIALQKRIEQI
jgi:hypothetical protein